MTAATLELYKALIAAGVDEKDAKTAANAVVGREESLQFANKTDIAELKIEIANTKTELQRFLFLALVSQAVFVIGMTVTLIQILS
jgi:hypothetical protein